jgi:hypothetical protein
LGYIPVFYVHRVSGGNFFPYWTSATTSTLVFNGYLTSSITLKWKVFRRPLKTNYKASAYNPTDDTKGVDSDYGIIVSLPGKDINSIDKRDFCIRSDVRQLMVHQSGYTTSATNTLTINHNLGYKPCFWFYIEGGGGTSYHFLTSSSDLDVSADEEDVDVIFYSGSANYAYIIFKDTLTSDG